MKMRECLLLVSAAVVAMAGCGASDTDSGALHVEITDLADTGLLPFSDISPDGNWYVLVGDGELCIHPTVGGGPTCVPRTPGAGYVDWSPDSTQFLHGPNLFRFREFGPLLLTSVDGTTTEVVPAPDDDTAESGVADAVFVDADTIAYLWLDAGTTFEIRQVTIGNATPTTLLRLPPGDPGFPDLPLIVDDNAAYLRFGSEAGPYEQGVHRFAFDGSAPQLVIGDERTTRNSRDVSLSMWPASAHGDWVVSGARIMLGDFGRNRDVGPFFYLSTSDGTAGTYIPPVDPDYVNSAAELSPDGTLIAVFSSYIEEDSAVLESERAALMAVADTATILTGEPNWSPVQYIARPTFRIHPGLDAVFWSSDNQLHVTTTNGMFTITVARR